MLMKMFPKKLTGYLKYAEQYFDELFITFVSILVMLRRYDQALYWIE